MSPANFAATNPEAMKTALETQGGSMRAGFANLLQDLKRDRISITDETAFEVGRNVAVSKGGVRERTVPADPVRTTHRRGRRAAARDRATLHQQVLHPRPPAGELVRAFRVRTGADGVPRVVAQP
jgi:hypothetical protein